MKNNTLLKILVIAVFLVMRLLSLGPDISNSDATRWHRRSENFLTALKEQNFAGTYQHYQPGVSLMLLNAIVKQASFSYQYKTTGTAKTLENADYFPFIHGISKAVLVIVLAVLLFAQMHLLDKIFTPGIGLFYGGLIAVEPYLVGIDRWFHLTSLETYTAFTAFLFTLYFLRLEEINRAWKPVDLNFPVVAAGLLLGVSVLSKTTSLIVFPIALLIILFGNSTKTNAADRTKSLILFLLVFGVTLGALFPSFWVEPVETFQKLVGGITNAVSEDARIEGTSIFMTYGYYLIILIFKAAPLTLLLGIASLITFKNLPKEQIKYILWTLLYLVLYLIAFSISVKKIDRYVISLFPPVILFAAVFVNRISGMAKVSLFLVVMLFTFFIRASYHPVYSAYYSPIFGQTPALAAFDVGFYNNSGEYYSDAAFYLNTKSRDTIAWVPHNHESFIYYYKGNWTSTFSTNVNYAVTSLEHKNEISKFCPTLEASFGSQFDDVVFVYSCPNGLSP